MLTTEIEKKYRHAVVSVCCENNCMLRIDAEREHVILKGEKLTRQGKICDCIIFQNDGDSSNGRVEESLS